MSSAGAITGNKLFPVFLKLENLRVLIVGGGSVALEKLKAVLENSPAVQVLLVAPSVSPEIKALAAAHEGVELREEAFAPRHLEGMQLVITAVNDVALSEHIRGAAHAKGLLVNAADKPDLCDFYLSSVVKKGDLKIAISTNGKSPTMAKRVKETLDEAFPDEINEVLENLYHIRNNLNGDFRKKVERLNAITSEMVKPKQSAFKKRVMKTALYSVLVLALMFLGHLLFTFVPAGSLEIFFSGISASLGKDFLLYVLGGMIAQMIDGALGMAYGVSVTTFLLSLGIPAITPAVASASMHASEIFTTGTASLVYMRYRNVNKKLFRKLLVPGIIGAAAGAAAISFISKDSLSIVKPLVSVYTLVLGVAIILKAVNFVIIKRKLTAIAPIAAAGGFLDSVGGGGWGPIVTTTLVAGGRNLKYAVGSSHLAKFFVALVSTITFFSIIGLEHWKVIFGLVAGGMIAAPFSIYISNKIPVKKGLILVGIIVILISARNLILFIIK